MCFHYQNGELRAEEVSIKKIAEQVGTPFYCYSTEKLTRNFDAYRRALADENATICYSVKANPNLSVVAALARLGGGADVVSAGEMYVASKDIFIFGLQPSSLNLSSTCWSIKQPFVFSSSTNMPRS